MVDGFVIVSPDSTGKKVETSEITKPDGSLVERQRAEIGDGLDIPAIRRLLEQISLLLQPNTQINIEPGRSVSFDQDGNLRVGLGVSISGGCHVARLISTASTNATLVKPSNGQIFGWYMFNVSAGTVYLKLFNKPSKPLVGQDLPLMTLPLPAGAAANVWIASGISDFTQGISFAITGGAADTDATNVAAGDLIVNLLWM